MSFRSGGDAGAALIVAAFLVAALALVGAGMVYAIYDLLNPPGPEQLWISQQVNECRAMRSELSYNKETQTVRCYRTPFMRRPKLMFERTYAPQS